MPVTVPTPDQLKQIAGEMGLSLTESDVASFIDLMRPNIDAYNVIDHLPDNLPKVSTRVPLAAGPHPRRMRTRWKSHQRDGAGAQPPQDGILRRRFVLGQRGSGRARRSGHGDRGRSGWLHPHTFVLLRESTGGLCVRARGRLEEDVRASQLYIARTEPSKTLVATVSAIAELAVDLLEEDRLCIISQEEQTHEPRMICSMGLNPRMRVEIE
jgi:hypothetical protein